MQNFINSSRLERWVFLPSYNDFKLKAKIDTGARTSAIHATNIQIYLKMAAKWLSFKFISLNLF